MLINASNIYQHFLEITDKNSEINQNETPELAAAFEAIRELSENSSGDTLLSNSPTISDETLDPMEEGDTAADQLKIHLETLNAYFLGKGLLEKDNELTKMMLELKMLTE